MMTEQERAKVLRRHIFDQGLEKLTAKHPMGPATNLKEAKHYLKGFLKAAIQLAPQAYPDYVYFKAQLEAVKISLGIACTNEVIFEMRQCCRDYDTALRNHHFQLRVDQLRSDHPVSPMSTPAQVQAFIEAFFAAAAQIYPARPFISDAIEKIKTTWGAACDWGAGASINTSVKTYYDQLELFMSARNLELIDYAVPRMPVPVPTSIWTPTSTAHRDSIDASTRLDCCSEILRRMRCGKKPEAWPRSPTMPLPVLARAGSNRSVDAGVIVPNPGQMPAARAARLSISQAEAKSPDSDLTDNVLTRTASVRAAVRRSSVIEGASAPTCWQTFWRTITCSGEPEHTAAEAQRLVSNPLMTPGARAASRSDVSLGSFGSVLDQSASLRHLLARSGAEKAAEEKAAKQVVPNLLWRVRSVSEGKASDPDDPYRPDSH